MFRRLTENLMRGTQAAPKADDGGMDFDDGPLDQYDWATSRTIEALALEPVIAPSLTRMHDRVAHKEQILAAPKTTGLNMAEHMVAALSRRPSKAEAAALGNNGYALLKEPAPGTPNFERFNPFEDVNLQPAAPQAPERPKLAPRPQSHRTRREPSLLVQTLRRNHQQVFINNILEQVEAETRAEEERLDALFFEGQDGPAWQYDNELQHWADYTMAPKEPVKEEMPLAGASKPQRPNLYRDDKGHTYI